MRIETLLPGSVLVLILTIVALPISAQTPASENIALDQPNEVGSVPQFATLGGVEAVPMASSELHTVKGMHLHFFDPAGNIHFIGLGQTFQGKAPLTLHNGSADNIASGRPVHQGYNGLCRAAPILITPDPEGPFAGLSQC